ncbi:MAG: DUF4126 domain-containing protein [Gammaproteobacteria bacterium]|nr:DUF4126 domain-containing protein [Gammaproteobacteria bacterium]MBU1646655.1 DUF4126 domain-containing protein [Gammaproteobacteria bacterium]MBU1971688.1 DUF4126 domain-containing protein [Gammaproteobacteria bacterium]
MTPDVLAPFALAAALAAAAGLRFYGVVFFVGFLGSLGVIQLPGDLQLLTHPAIVVTSGVLFAFEFLADKVPLVDSLWDLINTFVRIPGGALLAALALANQDSGMVAAAALLGGLLAGGTHVAKMGTRATLNLSPEPVSNWLASFAEDGLGIGLLVLALAYPLGFLGVFVLLLIALVWLLSKVAGAGLRLIRRRTIVGNSN